MYTIRKYNKEQDLELICSWCKSYDLPDTVRTNIPEDTTYILEYENQPIMSACLYLTNCKNFSFIENAIKDKKINKDITSTGLNILFSYLENKARELGYKMTFIMADSDKDKLKNKYMNMGYTPVIKNITLLCKGGY